jgi:DUF4097 and DUF4098 domain-containing protein YvlB
MLRFFIRLTALVIVASLPIPLHAQAPPLPPAPPQPAVHAPAPPQPPATSVVVRSTTRTGHDAARTAAVVESIVSETVAAATHAAAWSAMSWKESWEAKQGPEITERINKSFKVGQAGSLDISNISGDIIVNEGGGDTITIDAVKKFRGRDTEAKSQFAQVEVTMVERAGRVEVKTVYDRSTRNHKASVDYTVTAPAGTSVYAHAVSGDIRITNIKGEVRIDTVSGDASAIGTPGATLVKTISGDASVSGVSNANELRAMTVSGDVTVTGAKARAVDADSISGSVTLTDVACDRATAKSISGDIAFGGALARSGRYEFKSQSGDIRVTLAGTPGFELDASSFSGNVRSDLPITIRAGEPIGGSRGPGKKVRGTFGDGSASLVLVSFSGNVVIAKK